MEILGKLLKIADVTTGHTANILDAVTNYALDIFESDLKVEKTYTDPHIQRLRNIAIENTTVLNKALDYEEEEEDESTESEELTIDMDRTEFTNQVFNKIVGYDNKKEVISMALLADNPTHLLLIGKKGTGKTMFMDLLYENFGQENCLYAVGDSTTDAGLKQLLFDIQPKYIFIDEIDKARGDVQDSMLTLMQNGLVSETKVSKTREMTLDKTWVIMTANDKDSINPYLADRCIVIEFPEYTVEQFMKITPIAIDNVKPNVSVEIINYVIERMVLKKIKSVRTAVKVACMAKTRQDVDLVLDNSILLD